MLLAAVTFSAMGATVKFVGARLDSFEIAFFRCLFGFIVILPALAMAGPPAIATRRLGRHVVRAGLGVAAMSCGFYAVVHMPLADASALSFTNPLFVTVLAVMLLGESMQPARWLAVALGLAGVVVMVRPGAEGFDSTALVALLGALLVALVKVLVKQLSVTERPLTILFYFGLVSTALALVPALLVWKTPTMTELALLAAIGGLGATAQNFTIRAFAAGEATAVAPIDYTRLIFATAFGWLIFGDLPGPWTLVGAGVIVVSTVVIGRAERRAAPAYAVALTAASSARPSAISAATVSNLRSDLYQDGASPSATAAKSALNKAE